MSNAQNVVDLQFIFSPVFVLAGRKAFKEIIFFKLYRMNENEKKKCGIFFFFLKVQFVEGNLAKCFAVSIYYFNGRLKSMNFYFEREMNKRKISFFTQRDVNVWNVKFMISENFTISKKERKTIYLQHYKILKAKQTNSLKNK